MLCDKLRFRIYNLQTRVAILGSCATMMTVITECTVKRNIDTGWEIITVTDHLLCFIFTVVTDSFRAYVFVIANIIISSMPVQLLFFDINLFPVAFRYISCKNIFWIEHQLSKRHSLRYEGPASDKQTLYIVHLNVFLQGLRRHLETVFILSLLTYSQYRLKWRW